MTKSNIGHRTNGKNSPATGDITVVEILKDVSGLNSRVISLEKKIDGFKTETPRWVYYIGPISLLALALSGISLFMKSGLTWNVEALSLSIVLGFVGILATFIVVSNYIQVKSVEDKGERLESEVKTEVGEIRRLFTERAKEIERVEEDLLALKVQAFIESLDTKGPRNQVLNTLGFILKENLKAGTVNMLLTYMHTTYYSELTTEAPSAIAPILKRALAVLKKHPYATCDILSNRPFADFVRNDLSSHAESQE
jgi:hypothetical protein